jgi:hypothetical protein
MTIQVIRYGQRKMVEAATPSGSGAKYQARARRTPLPPTPARVVKAG